MDNNLKLFLNKLTIGDDEIKGLIDLCQGLEFIDVDRAKENVKVVTLAGFPLYDISSLIYANPGFLCNNPERTKNIIMTLDGDVEEILKNNPYIL